RSLRCLSFFFIDPAPPQIYTLSLHDALPIFFTAGFDPVAVGLVASLNQPGGNITGVGILDVELGPKRLELLHELVPTATMIAVRSEEHTSELQSRSDLVCRLLLEKKKS